ncbi:MAG: aromatic amino acid lyase, partial [Gammaproteobacteria bacterium]|nr:aromatic amino acid lyase [Gammaproteobacteria bacterium]
MSRKKLIIDGTSLKLADMIDLTDCQFELDKTARQAMNQCVSRLRKIVDEGRVCYGVNTGFGAFANQRIERDAVEKLQYNLVRSHACGVGEPLAPRVVQRAMLLKANSLAAAHSGARPELAEALLAFLHKGIVPVIPSRG